MAFLGSAATGYGYCTNGFGIAFPGQPNRYMLTAAHPSGVAGAIYTGPWNSVSSVAVGGAASDYVGNVVNTGGASSGENPGLRVRVTDHFTAINGHPCAGSVGPLNYAEALGVGTISAGLNPAGCGAVDPAVCPFLPCVGYNRVYYAPLLRANPGIYPGSLTFYGIGILTL